MCSSTGLGDSGLGEHDSDSKVGAATSLGSFSLSVGLQEVLGLVKAKGSPSAGELCKCSSIDWEPKASEEDASSSLQSTTIAFGDTVVLVTLEETGGGVERGTRAVSWFSLTVSLPSSES